MQDCEDETQKREIELVNKEIEEGYGKVAMGVEARHKDEFQLVKVEWQQPNRI